MCIIVLLKHQGSTQITITRRNHDPPFHQTANSHEAKSEAHSRNFTREIAPKNTQFKRRTKNYVRTPRSSHQ